MRSAGTLSLHSWRTASPAMARTRWLVVRQTSRSSHALRCWCAQRWRRSSSFSVQRVTRRSRAMRMISPTSSVSSSPAPSCAAVGAAFQQRVISWLTSSVSGSTALSRSVPRSVVMPASRSSMQETAAVTLAELLSPSCSRGMSVNCEITRSSWTMQMRRFGPRASCMRSAVVSTRTRWATPPLEANQLHQLPPPSCSSLSMTDCTICRV
mmetsp:Transcript_15005/g.58768  ORF Transcript_15005/g.58768 Transcript_15005/m.58768 type:complete len:210 (+) Transcript_15005:5242-5871(+)